MWGTRGEEGGQEGLGKRLVRARVSTGHVRVYNRVQGGVGPACPPPACPEQGRTGYWTRGRVGICYWETSSVRFVRVRVRIRIRGGLCPNHSH